MIVAILGAGHHAVAVDPPPPRRRPCAGEAADDRIVRRHAARAGRAQRGRRHDAQDRARGERVDRHLPAGAPSQPLACRARARSDRRIPVGCAQHVARHERPTAGVRPPGARSTRSASGRRSRPCSCSATSSPCRCSSPTARSRATVSRAPPSPHRRGCSGRRSGGRPAVTSHGERFRWLVLDAAVRGRRRRRSCSRSSESLTSDDDAAERPGRVGLAARICEALPERHRPHQPRRDRLVRGHGRTARQFATTWDHHHDDRNAVVMAAPPGVQERLIADDPDRYFRPPYVGSRAGSASTSTPATSTGTWSSCISSTPTPRSQALG